MRNLIRCLFLFFLVLSMPSLVAEPRTDPETNVIRLLHIGKAWHYAGSPGPVFFQDPKISWFPVPAHAWSMGTEAFRMLRLYLPRSKDSFIEQFDVVAVAGMEALHLRLDFQAWLKEGMEKEGMGLIMADDSSSFGTSGTHTSWYIVPLGELLPVDDKPVGGSPYGEREAFHIVPVIPDHPFTRNIPWDEVWVEANNRPWPKTGSTVVTRMSEEHIINKNGVQMVYWDLGNAGGRSVAWIHAWNHSPEFWRWRYAYDVIAHVVYYSARAGIPEDLVLMHSLRSMIGDYFFNRVYAISTLEFADKFKANTREVEIMLEKVEDAKKVADKMFVDQEYEEAAGIMSGLILDLDEVIEMAIEAKDTALFWIFVIEWFVVTGTSMIAGTVLWTLMVRRRLYREVGETKLGLRVD